MAKMGQQGPARIVSDTDVHDEPHIEGTRITVREVQHLVEEQDLDPGAVADRFEIAIAAVYHALAYYHDNPEEMARVATRRQETIEATRDNAVTRPEDL